jgi:hypothetical protein
MNEHTQLRIKCRVCGLHFVVFTWEPEERLAAGFFCPECGQFEQRYVIWRIEVPGMINDWVPGAAPLMGITG